MGLLVFLTIAGFLYFAGDRISPMLWPNLPPALGAWILLSGFGLFAALLFPPSRLLAQTLIMAVLSGLLLLGRCLLQGTVALTRLMWTNAHEAVRRLWGDLRQ